MTNNNTLKKEIAFPLSNYRKRLKLSQHQLALLAGYTPGTVRNMERDGQISLGNLLRTLLSYMHLGVVTAAEKRQFYHAFMLTCLHGCGHPLPECLYKGLRRIPTCTPSMLPPLDSQRIRAIRSAVNADFASIYSHFSRKARHAFMSCHLSVYDVSIGSDVGERTVQKIKKKLRGEVRNDFTSIKILKNSLDAWP